MILRRCIYLFISRIYVFKWLTMELRIININKIYTIIYFYIGWARRIYVLAYAYIGVGRCLYGRWRIPAPAFANPCTCVWRCLYRQRPDGRSNCGTQFAPHLRRPSFSLSPRVRRTIPRDASALSRIYNFHSSSWKG